MNDDIKLDALPFKSNTLTIAINVFDELTMIKELVKNTLGYVDDTSVTYILGLIFSEYGFVASTGFYTVEDHKAKRPVSNERLANYLYDILARDTGLQISDGIGYRNVINKLAKLINRIIRIAYIAVFKGDENVIYVSNMVLPDPDKYPHYYTNPALLFLDIHTQTYDK